MPSLSSMPAFSTEGVVDSCRVSIVRLARTGGANPLFSRERANRALRADGASSPAAAPALAPAAAAPTLVCKLRLPQRQR